MDLEDLIFSYQIKVRALSNMLLDCPDSSVVRLKTKLLCYANFINELTRIRDGKY